MSAKSGRRSVFLLLIIAILLLLSSCGGTTPSPVRFGYSPFPPITFFVDTNGNISIQADVVLPTLVGEFSVETDIYSNAQADSNNLLVIIRHKKNGSIVDTEYKIQTGQDEIKIVADGRVVIDIQDNKAFIDASKGSIQSIEVNDANSGSTSTGSSQIPTPMPSSTPKPTPVPPTPTPIPPTLCTDQNGVPPSGVEATKMTVNCMLSSGYTALIVVCDEAHLLQPFDVEVQGPGIISYQNPSGSTSIDIEALNTPLSNAPCPAKFRVLPSTQVDGQVTQDTQNLKTLIGNNAGVTYLKVVGTNVTKSYS